MAEMDAYGLVRAKHGKSRINQRKKGLKLRYSTIYITRRRNVQRVDLERARRRSEKEGGGGVSTHCGSS